jgi:hypothetical protein
MKVFVFIFLILVSLPLPAQAIEPPFDIILAMTDPIEIQKGIGQRTYELRARRRLPTASSAETVMNFTVEDVEFPGWHYQRLVNTQDVHTGIWNSYSIIATTNLRYIAYTISGVWRQYIVVIP